MSNEFHSSNSCFSQKLIPLQCALCHNLIIQHPWLTGRFGGLMLQCTFKLNNKPMSELKIGAVSFPAFSGKEDYLNKASLTCTPGYGALPVGRYYIFDRQSGGILGPLKEWLDMNGNHKREWYSLYAIDGDIDDDQVICGNIVRGQFRLHPKGRMGRSEGCITIDRPTDWHRIRSIFTDTPKVPVPGSQLKAYGELTVT
jgi:Protein of unknown function (DUF2778)